MYARIALSVTATLALVFLFTVRENALAQTVPAGQDAQADLVINEIMASNQTVLEDPDEAGEYPDWLELHNPTGGAVSLDGLSLVKGETPDTVTFAITDGLSIPAGGFLLFYADDDPSQGPQHTNFRLNRELDKVGLYRGVDASEEIDSRSFASQTTDVSEGRDPDGGATWGPLDRPTPGRSNRARPPVIGSVLHTPDLPAAGTPIDITAVISDEGTIVRATIIYSATGTGLMTVPMSAQGENRYAGTIPPQADGAIVSFYVTAEDNDGEVAPDLTVERAPVRKFPIGFVMPTLVINEVMADNVSTYEDPDDPGDYPDWIELFNTGDVPVSLRGLYLSDNEDNPTKFPLPAALSVLPGGRILFLADEDPEQGERHTNFKLNKDGEPVMLLGAQGTVIVDMLDIDDLPASATMARLPDGTGPLNTVTYCPTPGRANLDCSDRVFLPFVTFR